MDGNLPDLSAKRDALYRELTDLLLKGLETGAISADDSTDASRYILERLDSLNSDILIDAFVETIAERWPVFRPALLSQKEERAQATDEKKVDELEKEIHNISDDQSTNQNQ